MDWVVDWLIGEFMLLAVPAYFFLQFFMARRYRDRWLLFALAPLVVMIPLVIHAVLALLAGFNLWPLLLIFVAPIAFIYLLGVAVVRAVVRP